MPQSLVSGRSLFNLLRTLVRYSSECGRIKHMPPGNASQQTVVRHHWQAGAHLYIVALQVSGQTTGGGVALIRIDAARAQASQHGPRVSLIYQHEFRTGRRPFRSGANDRKHPRESRDTATVLHTTARGQVLIVEVCPREFLACESRALANRSPALAFSINAAATFPLRCASRPASSSNVSKIAKEDGPS